MANAKIYKSYFYICGQRFRNKALPWTNHRRTDSPGQNHSFQKADITSSCYLLNRCYPLAHSPGLIRQPARVSTKLFTWACLLVWYHASPHFVPPTHMVAAQPDCRTTVYLPVCMSTRYPASRSTIRLPASSPIHSIIVRPTYPH